MISVGKYYAFEKKDDNRIEFYANYAKVLPYLNKQSVEVLSKIGMQKSHDKSEKTIYELAKCLHDNDFYLKS